MSNRLDDLYRDILMDHYRFPRGRKKLDEIDVESEGKNPVCGDEIEITLKFDGERVEHVSVNCRGCAISVASGSMLAETVEGKTITEVERLTAIVKAMLTGEDKEPDLGEGIDLGDLEVLKGVKNYPVRIKCALLSWTTLIDGIEAWKKKKPVSISTTE